MPDPALALEAPRETGTVLCLARPCGPTAGWAIGRLIIVRRAFRRTTSSLCREP